MSKVLNSKMVPSDWRLLFFRGKVKGGIPSNSPAHLGPNVTKRVLFIDLPTSKALPDPSVLRISAFGADVVSVTDSRSASCVLESTPVDMLVTNHPDREILRLARKKHPLAQNLLVTDLPMEKYSEALQGDEHVLIDSVIANRGPVPWTINELRITLQKILRQDIFGIAKYLAPATPIHELTVTGSKDREAFNTSVMQFAEENRLGQYVSKLVFGITEELLMNAIYDAPIAGGKLHYGELPRTAAIELEPAEYSRLTFGCDSSLFGISVTDPFGALTREKLFQYLKKVVRRTDSANLIDTKKGGAGLGLFKILYSSHSLICNVQPQRQTEVMALIDVQNQVRDFSKMARSVHFFSVA